MRWPWNTSTTRVRPAVAASGLVFALAGLMFVVAANTSQGTDLRAQRATELRDLVRQRSAHFEATADQVAGQQQVVDDLAAGRIGDPAVAGARAAVASLAPPAGLTEVIGRGLTISLDDAPPRDPDDPLWAAISANDVIVHQADVQAVVNALWRGGATAIQVMDQRIVATSSVQCVGNTLLLQGRVYSPPYTITAVGPIQRMRAALRADPVVAAYRSWADVVGLGYEVVRRNEVVIPGYDVPVTMAYARTTE
ncbi:MAG: DUF881 domain-containing protein [Actinomycetota bacterium]|nr:DUF881 domain-containing protein [Actinomycetota bacterium]